MTRNLLRAGALSCALMTSTAMCTQPALAQEANLSPPPENFVVSPGGVDMRSGRYAYSQTDLSIGTDAAALALTRTLAQPVFGHSNPFANFSHNWDILLSEKRINVDTNAYYHTVGGPGYQIEVSFAGRTETFRAATEAYGFGQVSRSGYAQLTWTGSRPGSTAVYTLLMSDGTEAVFRPIGSADCSSTLRCAYVSQVTQADGTRLSFEYDGSGTNGTRLRSVTSNRGYALLLEYSGMLVSKACTLNLAIVAKPSNNNCPTSPAGVATYSYDSAAGETRLASAVDAGGGTWGFVNAATSIGFVKPGETNPWLTNTITARTNSDYLIEHIVTAQSFADGQSYDYTFDEVPSWDGQPSALMGGNYTDGEGNETIVAYGVYTIPYDPRGEGPPYEPEQPIDESGPRPFAVTPGPVSVIDPLGRETTTDYCDPVAMAGLPVRYRHRCYIEPVPMSVTAPGGIKTIMTWDSGSRNLLQTRQVARPGSEPAQADIVRSSTHQVCNSSNFRTCTKPLTDTDARGAITNYDYDAAHGGLTRQQLPAPTSGAPRPETRHEYAQRYAWVSNGSGGYVQAANPVWVRTATSTCRTSAATGNPSAPCATSGDEVRTTYDYGPNSGPNNLALRGQAVTADGVTLRTCFTYDANGRRIAETSPGAQLTQCQ